MKESQLKEKKQYKIFHFGPKYDAFSLCVHQLENITDGPLRNRQENKEKKEGPWCVTMSPYVQGQNKRDARRNH
jgi:hypothetical protein